MTPIARVVAMAVSMCTPLFEPRIDVRTADQGVETLLRESWIGRASESFATKIEAAWLASRCRSLLRALAN